MNGYPILGWAFGGVMIFMMLLDLGLVHRRARTQTLSEAFAWTVLWAALAAGFAASVYFLHGREKALQFTAGYLLEQSLSVDNMFVFVLIFRYFGIHKNQQGRILHWGILGAVVMRLLFIWAGVALLRRLHWMSFLFGGLLLVTALRMAFQEEHHADPGKNPALRLLSRFITLRPELAALVVIEFSDVVFALDSIPAVIGVTSDPFIVYTSNIFAIMGLRSLFFLLAGLVDGLPYLKHGISAILAFVGVKMLLGEWYSISIGASLSFIAGALALSVAASLLKRKAAAPGN